MVYYRIQIHKRKYYLNIYLLIYKKCPRRSFNLEIKTEKTKNIQETRLCFRQRKFSRAEKTLLI